MAIYNIFQPMRNRTVAGFFRWELGLIILILAANAFLKLYHISDETIYGDEAYSIFISQQPIKAIIENFKQDQNPPLYFILLHGWIVLTGISDVSLKLLSVIFSILCCASLYFFAKNNFGIRAAFFAVLLFTFSNGQEFFARECRGFAMIQLLTVLSFGLYISTIEKPGYFRAAGLCLVNLLLLFSHYITVFIPVIQGLFSIFKFYKNRRGFYYFWISQFAALILFIPWIRFVILNLPETGVYWLSPPDWFAMKTMAMELFGDVWLRDLFTYFLVAAILIFILSIFFKNIFKEIDRWKFLLLLSWVIIPFFGDYYIAKLTPVFFYRYILYTTLGLYLFAGYFFSVINIPNAAKYVCFFVLLFFQISAYNFIPYKGDDWKELVPKIARLKNDSTAILISASYKSKEFSFYFDPDAFRDYARLKERLQARDVFAFDDNIIDWRLVDTSRFRKIILVQSHHNWVDPQNKVRQQLLDEGYNSLWEYQREEGNWKSARVSYYANRETGWFSTTTLGNNYPDSSRCDTWLYSMEVEKPNLDTFIHYYTGFEAVDSCIGFGNISGENYLKGSKSTYAEQNHPYSYGLSGSLGHFLNRKYLFGSVYFFCSDSVTNAAIVISIEKKNVILKRYQYDCRRKEGDKNEWNLLTFNADLRGYDEDAELKIFLFNNKGKVFLDEMDIYFSDSFF